jgi:hypothetical protein
MTSTADHLPTADELLVAVKAETDPARKAQLKAQYNEALQHEFDITVGRATDHAVRNA